MAEAESPRQSGREVRLLLVTIAVSVAALVALAQFRFPEQAAPPAEPAPAPLERLAARAAYDELASAMSDLERRLARRLLVYRVNPERASGRYVVAPRVTGSRAVVVLDRGETLEGIGSAVNTVAHDTQHGLAILMIASGDDTVVTPRTGPPRPGPRYLVIAEGTAQGPILRPVYVGRTNASEEARGPLTVVTMDSLQTTVPRGAAIFSLDGTFIGLVNTPGPVTSVFTAESLAAMAAAAQPAPPRAAGDLGIDVHDPSPAVLRGAGASAGVVVSRVRARGPAAEMLRPGDVIQSIDDVPVTSVSAFRQIEETRVPGAPTTIRFVRDGSETQATYRAADASVAPAEDGLGLTARPVTGIGIEVLAVSANSAAARAGIRRGDLILTLEGQPVAGVARLDAAYRTAKSGDVILLSLEREQQHLVVGVEKR
jgi:S1-C subfamily serine protease